MIANLFLMMKDRSPLHKNSTPIIKEEEKNTGKTLLIEKPQYDWINGKKAQTKYNKTKTQPKTSVAEHLPVVFVSNLFLLICG